MEKTLNFLYISIREVSIFCHYVYTVKIKRNPYFGLRYAAGQQNPYRVYSMKRLISKESKGKQSYNILEIGSWAGQSAIVWANQIKQLGLNGKVMCVDAWALYGEIGDKTYARTTGRRQMRDALKGDRIFKLFLHNIKATGCSDIISYRREVSEKYLPELPANYFDLVYIDGSHHYQNVKADIENSMRIVKSGGVICGDDLELQVSNLDESVDLQVVRQGTGDEYPEVPTHLGVTVAVWDVFKQNISSLNGFWAMKKTTNGYQEISL